MIGKTQRIQIIVAALLILIGGAIWYDRKEASDVGSDSTQKNDEKLIEKELTPGVSIVGDGDYKVEVEKVDPNAPSLDRLVVGKDALAYSKDIQDSLIKRSKDASAFLKQNGGRTDYWFELANVRKDLGDYQGALDIWTYLTKVTPDNHISYLNIGNLYHYQLKNYPKAEEYLLKATKLAPKYILGYRDLSDLYRLSYQRETMKAAEVLKVGLEFNPNHTDLLIPLAGFYRDIGDKVTALGYFEKALEQAKILKNTELIASLEKDIAALK